MKNITFCYMSSMFNSCSPMLVTAASTFNEVVGRLQFAIDTAAAAVFALLLLVDDRSGSVWSLLNTKTSISGRTFDYHIKPQCTYYTSLRLHTYIAEQKSGQQENAFMF